MDLTLLEEGRKGLVESCEHQTLGEQREEGRSRTLWRCMRCGSLFVEGRPPRQGEEPKVGAG